MWADEGDDRDRRAENSRVDRILGRSSRLEVRPRPGGGFGMSEPYRSVGEVFCAPNGHYMIARASSIARAAGPVPLAKSHSAPLGLCGAASDAGAAPSISQIFMEAELALGAKDDDAEDDVEDAWSCRGCGSRDTSCVSKNGDSALVCDVCGVVDGQATVALDRQKMCARAEDKTVVADSPWGEAPGHSAHGLIRSNGEVESALETRNRHLAAAGGTRVSVQAIKKHRMGGAQSRMRTSVLQDQRRRGELDAEIDNKLRRVLIVVCSTFDFLHLHKDIEETIRKETVRVVELAVRHARVCSGSDCQVPLASKPSALFGVCAVQAVLERLERLQSAEGADCHAQREMLRQNIDRVKQLKLQGTALNGTQRSITTAAIAMALGWGTGMADLACRTSTPTPVAPAPPPMAPLALPHHALHPEPASPGPSDAPSPMSDPTGAAPGPAASPSASPVYAVRDRVLGAVRSARAPESLRRAALAAIQTPEVAAWIEQVNLPLDVAALAVLTAVRLKLEGASASPSVHSASLATLRNTVCYQHSISTTTAEAAEARLLPLLPEAPAASPFGERAGDGIF